MAHWASSGASTRWGTAWRGGGGQTAGGEGVPPWRGLGRSTQTLLTTDRSHQHTQTARRPPRLHMHRKLKQVSAHQHTHAHAHTQVHTRTHQKDGARGRHNRDTPGNMRTQPDRQAQTDPRADPPHVHVRQEGDTAAWVLGAPLGAGLVPGGQPSALLSTATPSLGRRRALRDPPRPPVQVVALSALHRRPQSLRAFRR